MPHIKLEHTENIDINLIKSAFKQLRDILVENAGVKEENCKCKSIQILDISDDLRHFYHLEISLLKGRSKEIRKIIGQKSLESVREIFSFSSRSNKHFSLEIREINPEDYFTTSKF